MANSKISLPIYSFNIKNKLKKSKNPRIKILIKYVKFYNNLYLWISCWLFLRTLLFSQSKLKKVLKDGDKYSNNVNKGNVISTIDLF